MAVGLNNLEAEVRQRANGHCEYCRLPQTAFSRPFQIEHIIARQHGGANSFDNLAFACWYCNQKKGPNLTGIDPDTGLIVPLFYPRKDRWSDHFMAVLNESKQQTIEIRGLTASGRATVRVLAMNEDLWSMLRYQLWQEGMYSV